MARLRYNNKGGQLGASLGAPYSPSMGFNAASPNTMHYNGSSPNAGWQATNAFTAPGGTTLLVISFSWSSAGVSSTTDNSGGALTWNTYGQVTGGSLDSATISTAAVPTTQSGLIVYSIGGSTNTAAFCFVLDGASATMGAKANNTNASSLSLTTTQAGSWVFAAIAGHSGGQPTGYPSGQSNVMNGQAVANTSGGFYQYGWYTTAAQLMGANVTMSTTGGTSGAIVAVEITSGSLVVPNTITFVSAPTFATIGAGDYVPLVVDPPQGPTPNANMEVIYLTSYTSGQTTGTVSRGQEGTNINAHASGANWIHGATASDEPTEKGTTTSLTGLTTATETAKVLSAPGSVCTLYSVTVNQPCRLRLYATTAQATADISRAVSTDPTGNHGCLLELVLGSSGTFNLSPEVLMVNQNSTRDTNFAANVRCDSGTSINITLNGISLVP